MIAQHTKNSGHIEWYVMLSGVPYFSPNGKSLIIFHRPLQEKFSAIPIVLLIHFHLFDVSYGSLPLPIDNPAINPAVAESKKLKLYQVIENFPLDWRQPFSALEKCYFSKSISNWGTVYLLREKLFKPTIFGIKMQ